MEITSNSLSEVTSLGTSINPCGFPVYLEKEVKSHGSTGRRVAAGPSTIECKNWVGENS